MTRSSESDPTGATRAVDDSQYLFVLGAPGSGAGALRALLNADPRFAIGSGRFAGAGRLTAAHFAADVFFSPDVLAGSTETDRYAELATRWNSTELCYRGDQLSPVGERLLNLATAFPSAKLVYALRQPAATAGSSQDEAAWAHGLEGLFRAALDDRLMGRIFPVQPDWFWDGRGDQLAALLRFLDVEARPALRDAYQAACDRLRSDPLALVPGSGPLGEALRANRDLQRICDGLAADAFLAWADPDFGSWSPQLSQLHQLQRAAQRAIVGEKDRLIALRDWRIGRLLLHRGVAERRRINLAAAASQLAAVVRTEDVLAQALSTAEDPKALKARLRAAWKEVDYLVQVERRYPWQRDLSDALDRCSSAFALPGGGRLRFGRVGDRLVAADGTRAYEVRDNAVRARPMDMKLVGGLVEPPAIRARAGELMALDVGTKSGDGFRSFVRDYADLVGFGGDDFAVAVGVDLNEVKLAGAIDSGLLPVLADGAALPFHDDSFDVVVAMELIEHVAEPVAIEVCRELRRVGRGGLFIQNPDFTQEEYLASLGLRFSWMSWPEHCHHVTQDSLRAILRAAGFDPALEVEQVLPVVDSSHPLIVPTSAPPRTERHTSSLGEKPHVVFDRPVFEKLRVVVRRPEGRS